jgi:hypothetical protein
VIESRPLSEREIGELRCILETQRRLGWLARTTKMIAIYTGGVIVGWIAVGDLVKRSLGLGGGP